MAEAAADGYDSPEQAEAARRRAREQQREQDAEDDSSEE